MSLLMLATFALAQTSTKDVEMETLKDGFVRVKTSAYSIEIPKGWEVTPQTSFGQREMMKGDAKMSAMTAGGKPGPTNWNRLYQTAVYFSTREGGKATPYVLSKSTQGYEAMSYTVVKEGFAFSRYVILRAPSGSILALSVKIPTEKRESELVKIFDRLVKTAKIS